MMKLVKFVFWTLAVLVLLAVLLVATLPLWFGPVARPIANRVAPTITKTDFGLGHLSFNPYTGRLEVGDVQIGNPAGYSEPRAVALGSLTVVADLPSVFSDCIHVREVTLTDCFVSYLYGGENNVDNLTQLQMNVAGGKEKYEAAQRRQEAADEEAAQKAAETPVSAEESGPARRLVIDRLTISGVRVKLQMLTIPVPTITLTDLGRKSGGVTLTELTAQVWDAVLKSATKAGDGAAALGGLINTTAGDLGTAVKDAGKATGESLKTATDTLQSTAGSVNDGVKQLGDDAKKTVDAFRQMFRDLKKK